MAKQIRTPTDQSQVNDDFDTFQLGANLSFDNRGNTFYGTTDPTINLSMVNIRHLNNTRMFRGTWVTTPVDGDPSDMVADEPAPYTVGQVVIGVNTGLLYQLKNNGDGTQNPESDTNQEDWRILGREDRLATELTSDPTSIELPLFSGNQSITFQVNEPAPYGFEETPTVTVTPSLSSTPGVTAEGVVTAVIPNEIDASNNVVFTTEGRLQLPNSETSLSSTVDTPVTFTDQRQVPTVSREGEEVLVSRLSSSQGVEYDITLVPSGTSVGAGTAYDVTWSAMTGGGTASTGTTSGTYTAGNVAVDTDVTFTFPLRDSNNPTNGQTELPRSNNNAFSIVRRILAINPWYYIFSDTAPTSLTGATEVTLVGDTGPRAFPTNNMSQVDIEGNEGETNTLWLLVDATIDRDIVLNTGVANVVGERAPTSSNVTVNDIAGNPVRYRLHRFRLGLVRSPTRFTILSA